MRKYISLAVFLILLFSLSGIAGYITSSSVDGWYKAIEKPSFNPPNWVFGPVWATLYAMIAISGWLVWKELSGNFKQKITTTEFKIYGAQVAANFIWSVLFFGMERPFYALIDIILLLVLIGLNIRIFKPVSKTAAFLLAPYFCWVAFALTLNLSIVWLN